MNYIVVQSKSDLSFIGERCPQNNPDKNIGILIKPSKQSGIKIWFPIDEIKEIIFPDMTIITEDRLVGFCTEQKAETVGL